MLENAEAAAIKKQNSMDSTVMGKIILPEEYRIKAWEFAKATAHSHKEYNRTIERITRDIHVGKMGEIAFCLIHKIPIDKLNFKLDGKIDGGYDLTVAGTNIDVKTTAAPVRKVYFNKNYSKDTDAYAIMSFNSDTFEFTNIVIMTKEYAFKDEWCKPGETHHFWDLSANLESMVKNGHIHTISIKNI